MSGREDRRVEARGDVVDEQTADVLGRELPFLRGFEQAQRPAARSERVAPELGRVLRHLEERAQRAARPLVHRAERVEGRLRPVEHALAARLGQTHQTRDHRHGQTAGEVGDPVEGVARDQLGDDFARELLDSLANLGERAGHHRPHHHGAALAVKLAVARQCRHRRLAVHEIVERRPAARDEDRVRAQRRAHVVVTADRPHAVRRQPDGGSAVPDGAVQRVGVADRVLGEEVEVQLRTIARHGGILHGPAR